MIDAKVGSVTGTAAEIIVELGFKPSYILLQELDTYNKLEYWDSLTNGTGLETAAATGIITLDATNGIETYDSYFDDTTGVSFAEGFKIEAGANVNVDTATIVYLAVR